MRRSPHLTLLLILAAACSTDTSGANKPAQAEDDMNNAAADDERDGSLGAGADGGGTVGENPGPGAGNPPDEPPADEVPAFLSFNDMIRAIRSDVLSIENPAERRDMRYLVLSHLGNSGFANSKLAIHRSTMNLLVNSLSRGSLLVKPEPLADAPNVYRIDLRDYRWTSEQWEAIVADYPFQVQYRADSVVYKRDEKSAEDVREATGTQIPFVFMEWFADHALRPQTYYDLLSFPDTLQALGAQVDVDIEQDIADRRIARAGVSSSGFAKENRMLERHTRIGNLGTFWISYDFDTGQGVQDIFAHPFDFVHVGSEIIYALPNGLSAYMVVDQTGKRVDAVPLTVGADQRSVDKIATPGLSCMGGCHYAGGFEPIKDVLRAASLLELPVGVSEDDVKAVFPAQKALDDLLASDRAKYVAAAASLGVDLTIANAPYQTVELNRGDVDLKLAAALLQLSDEEMRVALLGAANAVSGDIRGLREGRPTARETFEAAFAQTVCAFGLGEPLCAARDCSCATIAP